MAIQALTTTPTLLANLETDRTYTLQFRSASKSYVEAASTAPTDSTGAFIVGTNGVVTVKKTSSTDVYVWADSAGGNAVYAPSV